MLYKIMVLKMNLEDKLVELATIIGKDISMLANTIGITNSNTSSTNETTIDESVVDNEKI